MSEQFDHLIKGDLDNPWQALEDMCVSVLKELQINQHLQQVSRLCQQATYDEKMHDIWRQQCREDQEALHHVVAKAKNKGELRDDLSVEVATTMVMCFMTGVIERWLMMPEYLDLEQSGEIMLRVFMDGLKKRA